MSYSVIESGKRSLLISDYKNHRRTTGCDSDFYNHYKTKVSQIIENTFIRLVNSLKGKTAVIPLSGGFDSRLIAVMLKKHNLIILTFLPHTEWPIHYGRKIISVYIELICF